MILQEGSHNKALYFEFSEQWIVCKYDDHTGFYHKVQMTIVLFLHQDKYLDANEHFKPLALRLKTRIKQQLRFFEYQC